MKRFSDVVRQNSPSFGAIPFWSWNDKLEGDELRRQIQNMKGLGMRGFFMHARTGLVTEYLSDEWFEHIKTCMDEAEKLGMEAWAYDENGWPSGFCGGKLLSDENLKNLYLRLEVTKAYPEKSDDLLGVYTLDGDHLEYLPSKTSGGELYYSVYRAVDDTYVDLLQPSTVKAFIESTHELYKERLGSDLGKRMPGFFTDEPQYCRFAPPFSHVLEEEFLKKYGYSLREKLLGVFCDFDGAREFRHDYFNICHELYIDNFVKPLSEWCRANNVKLTGHTIEETNPSSNVKFTGSVMEFYEYQDIPGIDYLGRGIWFDCPPMQLSSVGEQLGKKELLSESFAAIGWEAEPTVIKQIADYQYVGGVNLLCPHLYSYSERGVRKGDYPMHYSQALPWQKQLAFLFKHYANLGAIISEGRMYADVLMLYPLRSAYMAYKLPSLDPRDDRPNGSREVEMNILDDKFYDATRLLTANQISFHYMDESLFKKYGRADGAELVLGNCRYTTLVIPYSYTIDSYTAEQLKIFSESGGRILLLDRAPDRIDGRVADLSWLRSTITVDELLSSSPIKVIKAKPDHFDNDGYRDAEHDIYYIRPYPEGISTGDGVPQIRTLVRDTDYGRMYFCSNLSHKHTGSVELTLRGIKRAYELDIDTLEERAVHGGCDENGDVVIRTGFDGVESKIFVSGGELSVEPYIDAALRPIRFDSKFELQKLPENALVLDFAELSYDGVSFESPRAVVHIADKLMYSRFSGRIWLKHRFTAIDIPEKLQLVFEPMKYISVTVNGKEIAATRGHWLDNSFEVADIASLVREGENEIVYSLEYYQRPYVYYVKYETDTESLKNCLTLDTELAAMYLFGEFKLSTDPDKWEQIGENAMTYSGGFALSKPDLAVDISNIARDGYPFFAGNIKLKNTYGYKKGEPAELCLSGRFALAEAEINGVKLDPPMMFTRHVNIEKYLREGDNDIVLTLYNSNFNLLGPHHINGSPVPTGAGPEDFAFENAFCDREESDRFDNAYGFVRFGHDEPVL